MKVQNKTQQPARVLVIHGPNLNLLGKREPGYYGVQTLETINNALIQRAKDLNLEIATFQSNSEGALIERVHEAGQSGVDFILINPAGYTHTSVALRDAILGVGIPFIEIHLSNIHKREPFRHHSYFSDIALGVICGLGAIGYEFALTAAANWLQSNRKKD